MGVYAAKSFWPGLTRERVDQALATLRPDVGGPRHLGSLLFPDDELVLCLFDGSSPASVAQAAERAGIPCERVMPAMWLNGDPPPRGRRTAGRSA
jgi:hypothetical protein